MKKHKIMVLGSIFSLLSLVFPAIAGAVYDGGTVSVAVRVEASKNGGAGYCYSGDCATSGQTLTASPGDTITFTGRSWNTGVNDAAVGYQGVITNTQYIETINIFEGSQSDLDGDTVDYDSSGYSVDGNGTATFDIGLYSGVNPTYLSTSKNSGDGDLNQRGSITLTLKNTIPDQTVITGTFELTSASVYAQHPGPMSLLSNTARAQGLDGGISEARLLVSNPSQPAAQTLPQTGAPTQKTPFLPYFLAIGFVTISALTAKKLVRKVVKK